MSKFTKSKKGAGQVVEGDIVRMKVMDFSDCISKPEEWTRGPVLPVGAEVQPSGKKRSKPNDRKRRT